MTEASGSTTIKPMNASNALEENVFPNWFLDLIRCPNSGGTLSLANPTILRELSDRHGLSPLTNKLGRTISAVPTQGLVSQDGRWFYPIEHNIPCLLPDEAIEIPKFIQPTTTDSSRGE